MNCIIYPFINEIFVINPYDYKGIKLPVSFSPPLIKIFKQLFLLRCYLQINKLKLINFISYIGSHYIFIYVFWDKSQDFDCMKSGIIFKEVDQVILKFGGM